MVSVMSFREISKGFLACFLVLAAGLARGTTGFYPPRLPPSEFPDTEASSNFVFSAGTDAERNWILAIEANVSSNNNVQIEFGQDGDGDGCLAVNERELVVGWDCGEWIVRERRGGGEAGMPGQPGRGKFVLRLVLDEDRNGKSASVAFRDFDVSRLFNPAWSMARVVVRGPSPLDETIKSVLFQHPFVLRLR